ncbi:MAG: single-stranded DNA-binding protein, partial [Thaumarchaeota archaeon]|nr:single-stranded DNA-binding protein [Nitrososphaerota archaeon]
LMGNLTRDPEMRVTPKGTAICQFSLAVSRSWKDETGQTREETAFVDIESWGKQGEVISKYCTKGRPLFVEGRLKLDQWEDKTSGQKRSKLKVVLENFQFIGGRGDGTAPGGPGAAAGPGTADEGEGAAPPPRAAKAPPKEAVDEDVPF